MLSVNRSGSGQKDCSKMVQSSTWQHQNIYQKPFLTQQTWLRKTEVFFLFFLFFFWIESSRRHRCSCYPDNPLHISSDMVHSVRTIWFTVLAVVNWPVYLSAAAAVPFCQQKQQQQQNEPEPDHNSRQLKMWRDEIKISTSFIFSQH